MRARPPPPDAMEGLRRFFVVVFGIACAMAAAFVFLPLMGLSDPALKAAGIGLIVFNAFSVLFSAMAGVAGASFSLAWLVIWWVALAVLGAPIIITALIGETMRLRSLVYYMALPAVLAALMPFILDWTGDVETAAGIYMARLPENRLILLLFLTGAVAGFVYWLAAGRRAGLTEAPGAPA